MGWAYGEYVSMLYAHFRYTHIYINVMRTLYIRNTYGLPIYVDSIYVTHRDIAHQLSVLFHRRGRGVLMPDSSCHKVLVTRY